MLWKEQTNYGESMVHSFWFWFWLVWVIISGLLISGLLLELWEELKKRNKDE